MNVVLIRVIDKDVAYRLDKLLALKTGISRSQAQKLIGDGNVLVDDKAVKPNQKLKINTIITVTLPDKAHLTLIPQDIPLSILYKDESLIVINKPPQMVVYPDTSGHTSGTLMNALLYHVGRLSGVGAPLRPGVVHRLDKETSGVMVIALEENAYYSLIEQFRKRTVNKQYIALLYGRLKEDKGVIIKGIGRSPTDRKKMSVRSKRVREAETQWDVIQRFKNVTLVNIRPLTGRTHQIRVHFASIGHPILGDKTYGKKTRLNDIVFPRQMLHARLLGFIHPLSGKYMEFSSPIPEDMQKVIEKLSAIL